MYVYGTLSMLTSSKLCARIDGGCGTLSFGGCNLRLPVNLSANSPKLWHTSTVEEKDGSDCPEFSMH